MRIDAEDREGEFGHVAFGNNHAAGRAQPSHDWRIARRRWRVRKDPGPRTRRLASDIEQVLDSDNCSVERTECYASVCSSIRRIGSGASGLGIDSKAGTLTFPLGIGYASKSLFQPVTSGA
jgi:hypothetical protein